MPDGTNQAWWRNAVIYQIYIRSFADGNGDGIGDIAGIRSRLPYLAGLGVDAIWITPWYPSPMADGGYDVADFRDIEPEFGTLAEAEQLIAEAHGHGLRVILDIVPNHTSDAHEWFQAALRADPDSPERARYWFRDGRGPDGAFPPNDWKSVFGGPAWARLHDDEGVPEQWYLHLFAPEQPDLNWSNPEVRTEFEDVLRFWFDRGVDGFRIDVAHGLAKHAGLPDVGSQDKEELLAEHDDQPDHPHWDRDEVHEIYRDWRAIADSYAGSEQGRRVFVAEAWVGTKMDRLGNYLRPDELHTAFNFDFLSCPWAADRLRTVIDRTLTTLGKVGAPATWVLSNHDVPREVTRYGREDTSLASARSGGTFDVELGRRRARAAALLMLALPGGAYVYQGEELGLPEVDLPVEVLQDPIWERSGHKHKGRDGCRVPLPWSSDGPAYCFGEGEPWLPQPSEWKQLSVEAQVNDADSMLALYRAAIALRRSLPGLVEGELHWLDDEPSDALAFGRGPGFACVVNLGPEAVALPEHEEVLLASAPLDRASSGPSRLPSDAAVWLRIA
jgi:alpha-glucosidase